MIVRMASAYNPEIRKAVQRTQEIAPVFRHFLMPIAVAGYALAAWRLGADLNLTGEFFISRGLFSHWQVWLALSVGTHLSATYFDRLGRSDNRGITA